MKKKLNHLLLGLALTASLTLMLHAAHPDASHLLPGSHDCAICQVVAVSDAPAALTAAPHFQSTQAILPDFVFIASSRLSLLTDPRGPPAA
jgi:hypothetical protein